MRLFPLFPLFPLLALLACDPKPSSDDTGTPVTDDTGTPVTDDDDADDDGFIDQAAGGDDCDDGDADINPGADEVPYDGIDNDCADGDQTDVDGDGHDAEVVGGDDCDDADPDVHPGADDAWYDGVDSDCAGNDDDDQDGDGHASDAHGGDDCDDTDPDIGPHARELAGDDTDSDCDGGLDTAWFQVLDTSGVRGIRGLGVAERDSAGELLFALIADEIDGGGSWLATGAVVQSHAVDDLGGGALGQDGFAWDPSYGFSWGSAFDFAAEEDVELWAFNLVSDSASGIMAMTIDRSDESATQSLLWTDATTAHADLQLTTTPDGSVHLVACHAETPALVWMGGTVASFHDGTAAQFVSTDSDAVGEHCLYTLVSEDYEGLLMREGDGDTMDSMRIHADPADGLSVEYLGFLPYRLLDAVAASSSRVSGLAYALGSDLGRLRYEAVDASVEQTIFPGDGDYALVDLVFDDLRPHLALADADGTVDVFSGDDAKTLEQVDHEPGLAEIDELHIWVTGAGEQVLVVRDDDEVVYSVVRVR